MAGCSEGNRASNLPVNILCLCPAAQGNSNSRTHYKRAGNLEYPYIIWAARN